MTPFVATIPLCLSFAFRKTRVELRETYYPHVAPVRRTFFSQWASKSRSWQKNIQNCILFFFFFDIVYQAVFILRFVVRLTLRAWFFFSYLVSIVCLARLRTENITSCSISVGTAYQARCDCLRKSLSRLCPESSPGTTRPPPPQLTPGGSLTCLGAPGLCLFGRAPSLFLLSSLSFFLSGFPF